MLGAPLAPVPDLPSRQPPSNPPVCTAEHPAERLTHEDNVRLEAAISAARRRWPKSALAEHLEREIRTWKDIGHRYDNKGLMGRLVAELLADPKEAA